MAVLAKIHFGTLRKSLQIEGVSELVIKALSATLPSTGRSLSITVYATSWPFTFTDVLNMWFAEGQSTFLLHPHVGEGLSGALVTSSP
jgi:hypothetical protein